MAHQTPPVTAIGGVAKRHWKSEPLANGQPGVQWACGLGAMQGHLNLLRPQRGVQIQTKTAEIVELLGIRLATETPTPAPLVDSWVCSTDACAIYELADSRRLRTTAQWRLLSMPGAAGPAAGETIAIELVVSTQTSRVVSDGATASICRLPATGLRTGWFLNGDFHWNNERAIRNVHKAWADLPSAAVCCLLCDQPISGVSLGLLVRRDEAEHLLLALDSTDPNDSVVQMTTWFFPTLIEKGVLHRGRIRTVFGSSSGDHGWIAAAAAIFAAEPPLLL